VAAGLRAGVAYVDVEGRLSRDFDRKIEGEAGSRMPAIGSKLGTLLGAGLATAAALAGAALAKGLSDSISREAGGDRLAAQLGLSEEASAAYGRAAGQLYADNYGDSLETVNEALKRVSQNIGDAIGPAEDALENVTGKVLNLADTFEQDLGGTTRAVGALIRNNLVADANEALDVITRGFQTGVDEADDFLDTLNEYSPLFSRLGLDAQHATGLLSQGLLAGARDSDTVADALKEFQIRATDASTLSAEGFRMLGLDAKSMTTAIAAGGDQAADGLATVLDALRATEDPVKRNAAAVALFGTKAEDLGSSLFALDPEHAVDALGQVTGAADKMGETLSGNSAAKIETFKRRALMGLSNFIGEHVIPGIERVWPVVENVVDMVAEKWPEIQAAVMPVVAEIVAFLQEKWPEIETTIRSVLEQVSAIVSGVLELVLFLWHNFGDDVLRFVTDTFSAVMRQIEGALQIIRGIVDLVLGILTGDWSRAWEGIKSIVAGVWNVIAGMVQEALAKLRFIVAVGFGLLKGIIGGALDGVRDRIVGAWNGILDFIRGLPGKISDLARGMWNGIWDAFRGMINKIIGGWNRLEFKIPGFDPPGPGPKFGGFTLGLPPIPELAEGGIVKASRGGTVVRAGEGGEDEVIAPIDALLAAIEAGAATEDHYHLELVGPFDNDHVDVEEQFRRMEILAGAPGS
jgi:TP901 family phage tail tape measure protein